MVDLALFWVSTKIISLIFQDAFMFFYLNSTRRRNICSEMSWYSFIIKESYFYLPTFLENLLSDDRLIRLGLFNTTYDNISKKHTIVIEDGDIFRVITNTSRCQTSKPYDIKEVFKSNTNNSISLSQHPKQKVVVIWMVFVRRHFLQ